MRAARRPRRPDALWLVRAGHAVVWAALLVGVAGGAVALLGGRPAGPAVAAAPPPAAPDVAAGGWAELYVASWLSAGGRDETGDDLAAFYPGPVDLSRIADGGRYASRTAAVQIRQLTESYWAVTVAAEVLEVARVDGHDGTPAIEASPSVSYRPGGVRYFAVGVFSVDGRFVATALPAEMPGPVPLELPGELLAAPVADGLDDDRVSGTVAGFLTGLLTQDGDMDRYVAPDVTIRPVRPAPAGSVELVGLSTASTDDGELFVLARVVLERPSGGPVGVSEYAVRLSHRDDRWEVAELLPAPPLELDEEGAPS